MKKDIGGRIARLALIAFVLCGAAFGALFLRGVYYVQLNADNWRLLPYIVPAAHYEQRLFTITTPEGASQTMDVSITCRDAQGREIRGITLHEGDLLPYYSDVLYEGNIKTVRHKDGRYYAVDRVTTDERGRDIRYDYADGSCAVMEYEGDSKEYSLSLHYDTQGILISRHIRTQDGNTAYVRDYEGDSKEYSLSLYYDAQGTLTSRHIRTQDGNTVCVRDEDGAGNPQYEILYTLDGRGNPLRAQSTTWSAGTPETDIEQYIWEYDDAAGMETRISEDGRTERLWYDEQGRVIKQETVTDSGTYTVYQTYTDITRQ